MRSCLLVRGGWSVASPWLMRSCLLVGLGELGWGGGNTTNSIRKPEGWGSCANFPLWPGQMRSPKPLQPFVGSLGVGCWLAPSDWQTGHRSFHSLNTTICVRRARTRFLSLPRWSFLTLWWTPITPSSHCSGAQHAFAQIASTVSWGRDRVAVFRSSHFGG